MAQLFELLTKREKQDIESSKNYGVPLTLETNIKELTIQQLSKIAFILIETQYNGKVPECFLSSEAINILMNRAIDKNIEIF